MSAEGKIWIALLRGINVGGHNKLPMAELRELFTGVGCVNVRTYIQSGNVVFKATDADRGELADRLASVIEDAKGFRPSIMLLTRDELEAAAAANPFPEATSEPKTLHLWFLSQAPEAPDLETLDKLSTATERYELLGAVLYLWAPDGIARSKLAARAERTVGVEGTARNWRTVEKLRELVSEVASSEPPDPA
ncbi:DUF1697 domain-containing protein [soil metagenome]